MENLAISETTAAIERNRIEKNIDAFDPGIGEVVAGIDRWLDSMCGPEGYGGPVVHWWRNSLQFTGVGLDWRYEGIIISFLNLYHITGNGHWLNKARRAGDDLIKGQLSTGNYRNSRFELNPHSGGTPHEAACDLALLRLASTLKQIKAPDWSTYLETAWRNIDGYYIKLLCEPDTGIVLDHPRTRSFVPNKGATAAEAFLLLSQITGEERWALNYGLPTLDAVLEHQLRGGSLDGAIYQFSVHGRNITRFFPYYIARCVPGLLAGYMWVEQDKYLEGAIRAMNFVSRNRYPDGSFPQVIYPGRRVNRYPQWIAATGDILRAATLLLPHGLDFDLESTLRWFLCGQQDTGAFRTAHGFASQVSQKEPGPLPDFKDLLPVAGWTDKAFRFLTEQWMINKSTEKDIDLSGNNGVGAPFETPCIINGHEAQLYESDQEIALRQGSTTLYFWRKGSAWSEINAPSMFAK